MTTTTLEDEKVEISRKAEQLSTTKMAHFAESTESDNQFIIVKDMIEDEIVGHTKTTWEQVNEKGRAAIAKEAGL